MKSLITVVLSIACLTASSGRAQTITTIAGNGLFGYSGDGGPATSAQLYGPHGVAVDSIGNVFISDQENNCVRKINTAGRIDTFAGMCSTLGAYGGDGLTATQANLNRPFNLIVDGGGNVLVSDRGNHVVRKIDTTGIITTVAGNGAQCTAGPCGDGGLAVNAQLYSPTGIAIDAAGNLFIGDEGTYSIRKVTPAGIITTIAGDPNHFTGANGNGNEGDGGPAHSSHLSSPDGLAFDSAGSLYFSDFMDHAIRKITAVGGQVTGAGIISRVAGSYTSMGSSGDGGPALNAKFTFPSGIAIDAAHDVLYVSDKDNRYVRAISHVSVGGTGSIINAFAGNKNYGYSGDNGAAVQAQVEDTWQIAVDPCGVYIADSSAAVIRKVSTSGCKKGMTWAQVAVNAPTGTVRVGCANACNASTGDTLCTTSLPMLCIRKSGTGFPLPLPMTVDNTNQYVRWSGGIVGTTAAMTPPSTLLAANAVCSSLFGADWRVAEFHDGWGWAFQAYGGVANPAQRFWVDINDSPNATCWTH